MLTHEEIIKTRLKNSYKGAINFYDIDKLAPNSYIVRSLKNIYEFMKNVPKNNDHLIIKIINNININGFAFSQNGFDYICIDMGTILIPNEYALRFTQFKDFFPDIYDFNSYSSIVNSKQTNFILNNDGYSTPAFYNGTTDVSRHELAFLIAQFAKDYILYHEVGHILDGHTEYLNDKYSMKIIETVYPSCNPEQISKLDWQTLELDADAFAACRTIYIVFIYYSAFVEQFPNVVKSQEHLLKIWSVALSIVSIYFGFFNISNDLSSEMYLPTAIRFERSVGAALEYLKKHKLIKMSDETFKDIVYKAQKQSIEINDFFLNKQSDSTLLLSSINEINEQLSKIDKNWRLHIRPALKKYARIGLSE